MERGALGVWLVGEAGALLVRGRRVHCWCVRVPDPDLPSSDRIAHLLLALREDEQGFATVANHAFAGARWRVRRRLPKRVQRPRSTPRPNSTEWIVGGGEDSATGPCAERPRRRHYSWHDLPPALRSPPPGCPSAASPSIPTSGRSRRRGAPLPARPPAARGPRGRPRRALRAPQARARLGHLERGALHCAPWATPASGSLVRKALGLADRRVRRDLRVQVGRRRPSPASCPWCSAVVLVAAVGYAVVWAVPQAVIYLALALWFGRRDRARRAHPRLLVLHLVRSSAPSCR